MEPVQGFSEILQELILLQKKKDKEVGILGQQVHLLKKSRVFAAALITTTVQELHPRSHYKGGALSRVQTGDQLFPILCHCQLRQDIPISPRLFFPYISYILLHFLF